MLTPFISNAQCSSQPSPRDGTELFFGPLLDGLRSLDSISLWVGLIIATIVLVYKLQQQDRYKVSIVERIGSPLLWSFGSFCAAVFLWKLLLYAILVAFCLLLLFFVIRLFGDG